jgi:hypothetical protein
LVEAEKLYLSSLSEVKLFLEAIYSKPLPNRGESVFLSLGLKNVKFCLDLFKNI